MLFSGDRAIASFCGVSTPTVSKQRKHLQEEGAFARNQRANRQERPQAQNGEHWHESQPQKENPQNCQ